MEDRFPELMAVADAETDVNGVVSARGTIALLLAADCEPNATLAQFRRDVRIVCLVTGQTAERIVDRLAPLCERCLGMARAQQRDNGDEVGEVTAAATNLLCDLFLSLYPTVLFTRC